ncbi:MAG: glycosyltransferase family 4 protein [Bacteroidia bacterium]
MANKKVILSHSGKQHSYYVAKNLEELGMLERFCTGSYLRSEILQKYFTKTKNNFWSKRFIPGLYGDKVDSNWRFELKYFLSKRFSKSLANTEKLIYEWDMAYDKYMSGRMKNYSAEFFWGFQGSCYESLMAAKNAGKTTICELSTAHVTVAKRILQEECDMHPEWAESISNLHFPAEFEKRLEQEPFRADYVFAASEFTKQTLLEAGVEERKVIKLPLGADVSKIKFTQKKDDFQNRPLKLLYAGTVTQRKGIKYLLETMEKFPRKDVELHIIGNVFGAREAFEKYKSNYIYHGPVSQQELFERYTEYDALVLPTVFEGFALVIIEAMAAGLPVITTPNCIGPDIIEEDRNGYLVPVRDVQKLTEAISKLRGKTGAEFLAMSENARRSAQYFTWENHKFNISEIFNSRISS